MAVTANTSLIYREEKGPLGNEAYNLTPQEVDGNFKYIADRLTTTPMLTVSAAAALTLSAGAYVFTGSEAIWTLSGSGEIKVKHKGTGQLTIAAPTAQKLFGNSLLDTLILQTGDSYSFQFDGTDYIIF